MNCILNVGRIDRIVRVVAGLAIAIAGVVFTSWWGVIGIVPLATGLMGSCPAYSLFKIDTRGDNE